jgi:hypothetical protein
MVDILQDLGIAPPQAQSGMSQGQSKQVDILQDLGIPAPSSAKEPTVTSAPSSSLYKKLISNPILNAGVAAGQSMGQAIDNMINLVARTHLKAPQVADPDAISTKVGDLLGMGTTYALGGEFAAPALGALGEAIPAMGRATSAIESLPGILKAAAGGAAFGASQAPQHPIGGAFAGGITGGALPLAGGALGALGRVLLSKEGVQAILRRGFGAEMNPIIKGRISQIMGDLRGSSSQATSNEDLFNRINQHYDELRLPSDQRSTFDFVPAGSSVGDEYAKLSQMIPEGAQKPLDRDAYDKAVGNAVSSLKQRIAPLGDSVLAQNLKQAIPQIESLKNVRLNSFGDAEGIKQRLNELIGEAYDSSDVAARSLIPPLSKITDGVRQSISDSAEAAGPDVAAQLKLADSRFQKEIVPFRQVLQGKNSPFMARILGKKSTDALVPDYIKPGPEKDQAQLMENFINLMPSDNGVTRKLAAYDYLKTTEDDPVKFINKYNRLGVKQKALLLPEYQDELENLSKLAKKYPTAFREQKLSGVRGFGTEALGLIGGGAAGASLGDPVAGALLGTALPVAAKYGVGKLLQRPGMAKFVLRELERRQPGIISRTVGRLGASSAVRGGIIGSINQGLFPQS